MPSFQLVCLGGAYNGPDTPVCSTHHVLRSAGTTNLHYTENRRRSARSGLRLEVRSAQKEQPQFHRRNKHNKEPRARPAILPATPCHVLIDNRRCRRHLQPISQTHQKCRRSHLRIFSSSRGKLGSQKGRPRRNCQVAFVPFHVSSGLLQYQQQQQRWSRTEILRPQRRRWWRMTPVGGGSGSPSLSHGTSSSSRSDVSTTNNDNENPSPPPATTTEAAPVCTN